MQDIKWLANFGDGNKTACIVGSEAETNELRGVLEANKWGGIASFVVQKGMGPEGFQIGVNLHTGKFILNGIILDPMSDLHFEPTHFRLIYFKRMRGSLVMGRGSALSSVLHRILLGWQTTHNDKNYQRIMFFDPETNTVEIKRKR